MAPALFICFSNPLPTSFSLGKPAATPFKTRSTTRPSWSCTTVTDQSNLSRRAFLLASAATLASFQSLSPSFAETPTAQPPFQLPDLPYAYDALQPQISEAIMRAHHDAHFNGYVKKLNIALANMGSVITKDSELKMLLSQLDKVEPISLRTQLRNNGGGYLNHKQFFDTITPGGAKLPKNCNLAKDINRQFGSFEQFEKQYLEEATSLFGSGFVWLVRDGSKMRITKYPNQDNPAMDGNVLSVLGCDCWEHAWYYQYGPKKADYIQEWWKVVNWSKVSNIYDGRA